MKKALTFTLLILIFCFFPSVKADTFFVTPRAGDAGTTQRLTFNLTREENTKLNLTLYVPPCDNIDNIIRCPEKPYYLIDPKSISVYPNPSSNSTEEQDGIIYSMSFGFNFPISSVSISFNAALRNPSSDEVDEWKIYYHKPMGLPKTNSTSFSVLAPLLNISFLEVSPRYVLLNSSFPSQQIAIKAKVENVQDENHHGNAYGVVLNASILPGWLPEARLEEKTIDVLYSGKAQDAGWQFNAEYGTTKPGDYTAIVKAYDKTRNYFNATYAYFFVKSEEPQPVCTECKIVPHTLECPSTVQAGSTFQISYKINASSKYEIQTILLNQSQASCFYSENYDACSVVTKTREILAPKTCGLYELKVMCSGRESSSYYCGQADGQEACSINVTGCESLEPKSLQLSILSPEENQVFLVGDRINLKVNLTYTNGSLANGAEVKVASPAFTLELFDDGLHADGNANDGVYGNSYLLNLNPGEYWLKFSGTKESLYAEKTVKIKVASPIVLTLDTDKREYQKNEEIKVFGKVFTLEGAGVANAQVLLEFRSGTWKLERRLTTNASGEFSYSYSINFGDPDGTWQVNAQALDSYGNKALNQTAVFIAMPISFYSLQFLRPIPDSNYKRNEIVKIEVRVAKAEELVEGAQVTCKSPSGLPIALEEKGNGIYSKDYRIGFTDPLGVWSISCQAVRGEGCPECAGNFVNVIVNSLDLNLTLLKPSSNALTSGELADFLLEVRYPDDSPVTSATATLKFQNASLPLEEIEPGLYYANFSAMGLGQYTAEVEVRDEYENYGKIEKAFTVQKSFTASFFEEWWPKLLPLLFLPSVYFVLRFVMKEPEEKRIEREIKKYEKELGQIQEMQRATQKEYFTRKIDEDTFRKMMEDFEKKSIECEVRLKNLRKELEKIKAEKNK